MRFSVLLSLYAKETPFYLKQCLESIWDQQTLKPTEIVLVLDGPIGEGLTKSVERWQQKLGNILKIVKTITP